VEVVVAVEARQAVFERQGPTLAAGQLEILVRRGLRQAYVERKLLKRITRLRVEALLVFSEAYLVGWVPARRMGVTVVPARMLTGYLDRRRAVMSVEEARGVAERLAGALAA
jgi:hypothetical protein